MFVKQVHGIKVNYLTLRFLDEEIQKDLDRHVSQGQTAIYKASMVIVVFRCLMVVVNYMMTREGLSYLISSVFSTVFLLLAGLLLSKRFC